MGNQFNQKIDDVMKVASEFIVGQHELLESMMMALICEGHLLIEGVPGLGKTSSVSLLAKLCELKFQRIQFTPDLLPSDLTGSVLLIGSEAEERIKFGPIFTQLLLADEINRAPAKIQSALLEAMQERQVTIGDVSYKLTAPFVVLATQNPIEQEGTFNLPEAQLDRFMMKVTLDYPSIEEEKKIILSHKSSEEKLLEIKAMLATDDFISMREEIDKVFVDEKIVNYIVEIVNMTRKKEATYISCGAGPRASLWLYKLAQYDAFRKGSDFVSPENLLAIAPRVLAHRIILSYEAKIENLTALEVIQQILKKVLL